ncbi:MAG TPA: hypothetical protein VN861_02910 [Candidatus Acidoferrales bacterium]|nr:hypothetical protein [Candidatus Acidoferrales bacterium]
MTIATQHIAFPEYSGVRCLMMPYVQGEPESVPDEYAAYRDIVGSVFISKDDIGFLTIDESPVMAGTPHRGVRAKFGRALHTEAGRDPNKIYCWGGGGWGRLPHRVTLDRDVRILLANNLDGSCVVWDAEQEETTIDGDIGHLAEQYPYDTATLMRAGDVHEIGILTPHESLPVKENFNRQFLRIVGSGVHGREDYFTRNSLVNWTQ